MRKYVIMIWKSISFEQFDKIKVNGDEAHPLFKWLKSQKGGIMGEAFYLPPINLLVRSSISSVESI